MKPKIHLTLEANGLDTARIVGLMQTATEDAEYAELGHLIRKTIILMAVELPNPPHPLDPTHNGD